MFSSRKKAERTAAQAWDYLSSAMSTAGDSAREAGGHGARAAGRFADQANKLAGGTGRRGRKLAKKANKRGSALADRAGATAGEAWARANAAADALAGRRRRRPWALIAGTALIGGAIGFATAGALRAAQERAAENAELEAAGNAVIVTPSYDD